MEGERCPLHNSLVDRSLNALDNNESNPNSGWPQIQSQVLFPHLLAIPRANLFLNFLTLSPDLLSISRRDKRLRSKWIWFPPTPDHPVRSSSGPGSSHRRQAGPSLQNVFRTGSWTPRLRSRGKWRACRGRWSRRQWTCFQKYCYEYQACSADSRALWRLRVWAAKTEVEMVENSQNLWWGQRQCEGGSRMCSPWLGLGQYLPIFGFFFYVDGRIDPFLPTLEMEKTVASDEIIAHDGKWYRRRPFPLPPFPSPPPPKKKTKRSLGEKKSKERKYNKGGVGGDILPVQTLSVTAPVFSQPRKDFCMKPSK